MASLFSSSFLSHSLSSTSSSSFYFLCGPSFLFSFLSSFSTPIVGFEKSTIARHLLTNKVTGTIIHHRGIREKRDTDSNSNHRSCSSVSIEVILYQRALKRRRRVLSFYRRRCGILYCLCVITLSLPRNIIDRKEDSDQNERPEGRKERGIEKRDMRTNDTIRRESADDIEIRKGEIVCETLIGNAKTRWNGEGSG